MFSIFTYTMSRVTHSEPRLPMVSPSSERIEELWVACGLYTEGGAMLLAGACTKQNRMVVVVVTTNINKLMSAFHVSVLLLIMNVVITLPK